MSGVAAIVLAAGQGRRMGGPNKLLAEIGGRSLVRHVVEAALASRARPVIVVTGHASEALRAALAGLDVAFAHNDDHANGLSTSLRSGLAALPDGTEGALVLLADMPFVTGAVLDRLVEAFEKGGRSSIIVPTAGGRRGNPVLWPQRLFPALMAIEGDKGGRDLLDRPGEATIFIEIGEAAARDLDTPEELRNAGGRIADEDRRRSD